MNDRFRFISLSRSLPAIAAAAFVVGPLALATEAKPPANAPAYGYKAKKDKSSSGKYKGNKSDRYEGPVYENGSVYNGSNSDDPIEVPYNNDVDSDYRNGGDRQRRVVEGVVRGEVNGQRFTMRSDDGRVLTVRVRAGAPARLSSGDRVRVEGFERAGRNAGFVADSVQILQNNNDNSYAYDWGNGGGNYGGGNYGGTYNATRRVSFPATVLDRDNARRLRVRGDNGQTYTVGSRYDLIRVDDGDRVRVEGVSRAGVVTGARVTLLQNNDANYNTGYGDTNQGEFVGRVIKVNGNADTITVRDDRTGRSYIFRPRQAEDYRIGQRVRATISVRDGRAILTRVTRI